MDKLKFAQLVCGFFPPILSQSIRNYIFSRKNVIKKGIEFSKKSVTGSVFKGNTLDFHSYPFSVHGFFDWRNIIVADFFLKNTEGDIIEIGANIGTETIGFCDILKSRGGIVHAFEPFPKNFKALQNLKKVVKNLKLYENAISNIETTVSFQVPPLIFSGIGKIIPKNEGLSHHDIIKVKTYTLDKFIDSFNNVKFISIDTEGHEPFVLKGSVKTLDKFRPYIVLEVSPKLLKKYSNSNTLEIYNFFKQQSYICYKINRVSISKINEYAIVDSKSKNWICIPEELAYKAKSLNKKLFIRAVLPWFLLKNLPSKK